MSALPPAEPVRVLLIDDSPLIRAGLHAVLEDRTDITICGEAGNAVEGLDACASLRPDVVLLDLRLPDQSGLAVCRDLLRRHPETRVLILTSATDERTVHEAVAAGARGYLLKDSDGETLAQAILRVAAGHSVLDASLTDHVINLMKRPPGADPTARVATLSAQERKVLALLTEGLTNKQIGAQLNLSEKTVKNYLSTVFEKLAVTRRAQAAALYVQATTGGN